MSFRGYLVITAIVSMIIYPVFGHWAWAEASDTSSGGWLAGIGFLDFSGGTVVHSVGGWVALAAVLIIGPRIGRYNNGIQQIHGHDIPMSGLGVLILFLGWFGFNGGSTTAANPELPKIITNTYLSGIFGGLTAMLISWIYTGKPKVISTMFGIMAGLVAITAPANVVNPNSAILIGIVGSSLAYGAMLLLNKYKIDDVVLAFPVHCIAGIWGSLAVALLGDATMWGTGFSRWDQFYVQLTGVVVCAIWSFGLAYIILSQLNKVWPLRVSMHDEKQGLNTSEHGTNTDLGELLSEMNQHVGCNDVLKPVNVQPHTIIGEIARHYNAVIESINRKNNQIKCINNDLEKRIVEKTAEYKRANEKLIQSNDDLRLARNEHEFIATHDTLTGLPNRVLLDDRMHKLIDLSKRQSSIMSVLFIDLDNFKSINDSLGHDIGDALLKEASERLASCIRESDTLARFGGDEFVCVLSNLNSIEDSARVAEKMINALSDPFILSEHQLQTTPSIGISVYPQDGSSREELIKHADIAMYDSKSQGRNTYKYYNESSDMVALENSLRVAIKEEQFELYYQPLVDSYTKDIVGAEALIRWNHPEKGLILPGDFIPLSERTNLIIPLGEWVLRTACQQNKDWQHAGLPPIRISVNLSARQLEQPLFTETVESILIDTGMDSKWLDLEVTETAVMKNPEIAITALSKLQGNGIHISMDDFGTGYSSLNYLQKLPIDTVKIDRSFIKELPHKKQPVAIIKAVIKMASSLLLTTVAEGVETHEQDRFLSKEYCNILQGNYFSPPVPAEAMSLLLEKGNFDDIIIDNVEAARFK